MKPLIDFLDRHPGATGTLGAASGFFSWLLTALGVVSGIAGQLAPILGCVVAGLTICILYRKWRWDHPGRRAWRDEDFPDDEIP